MPDICISDIRLNADRLPELITLRVLTGWKTPVETPAAASELLHACFDIAHFPQERSFLIATDNKYAKHVFELSTGTLDLAVLEPRDVFLRMLLAHAASGIVAHNHPSGRLTPSKNDMQVTRALAYGAGVLNMPVTDHLILSADGSFYSFREHDNLYRIWNQTNL